MARILPPVAVACAVALSGCGTFSDMICGPGGGGLYYRGVRLDAMVIRDRHPLAPLMAADLPFSAVADTAMIPYIAYKQEKARQESVSDTESPERTADQGSIQRLSTDGQDLIRGDQLSPQFRIGDALTLVIEPPTSEEPQGMLIVIAEMVSSDSFRFQGKRTVYCDGLARTTKVSGVCLAGDVRDQTIRSGQVIGFQCNVEESRKAW
jgi:uncharacterized protein YceK